jgi:hypothetical protein
MRRTCERAYIQNIGAIAAFLTFFCSAWFVLVQWEHIASNGWHELFLRIIGVIFVTFLAYVPYGFARSSFVRMPYKLIFLTCINLLFVVDLYVHGAFLIDQKLAGNFIVLAIFSISALVIIGCIVFCLQGTWYLCGLRRFSTQLCGMVRRIITFITRKRML